MTCHRSRNLTVEPGVRSAGRGNLGSRRRRRHRQPLRRSQAVCRTRRPAPGLVVAGGRPPGVRRVVLVVPAGAAAPIVGRRRGGRRRGDPVAVGAGRIGGRARRPPRSSRCTTPPGRWPGSPLWQAVLDAVVAGADGAVPAAPVTDTVKEVGPDGHLVTLDRSRLVAVQTPQAFRAAVLRRAHLSGADASDDAALVEAAGGRVVLVDGPADNLKVTSPRGSGGGRRPGGGRPLVTPRVGLGFDIHPFSDDPGRPLVLGGVTIEGRGLAGHSDADAVAHAICDALLGAAGLGDIGTHFPDDDPAYAGVDSTRLLARVVQTVAPEWEIGNVDVTVVIEAPKLAPHREEMERRLAEIVGAPVSVKAKRAEALGALGRREGVACFAVALLMPR